MCPLGILVLEVRPQQETNAGLAPGYGRLLLGYSSGLDVFVSSSNAQCRPQSLPRSWTQLSSRCHQGIYKNVPQVFRKKNFKKQFFPKFFSSPLLQELERLARLHLSYPCNSYSKFRQVIPVFGNPGVTDRNLFYILSHTFGPG